jgi:hypothetical protein
MPQPHLLRSLLAAASCLIGIAGLVLVACNDLSTAAEVGPETTRLSIETQVYASRNDLRPAEGVIMIVKADPDSPLPFRGPRQSFLVGRSGSIRAAVLSGPEDGADAAIGGQGTVAGPGRDGSLGDAWGPSSPKTSPLRHPTRQNDLRGPRGSRPRWLLGFLRRGYPLAKMEPTVPPCRNTAPRRPR